MCSLNQSKELYDDKSEIASHSLFIEHDGLVDYLSSVTMTINFKTISLASFTLYSYPVYIAATIASYIHAVN